VALVTGSGGREWNHRPCAPVVKPRSTGFGAPFETNLHVDATPTLERNGNIQTRIVVFYRPDPSSPGGEGNRQNAASVNLDFPIVLDSGKTIVASQTTDPGRDRRVTVEVTATILK